MGMNSIDKPTLAKKVRGLVDDEIEKRAISEDDIDRMFEAEDLRSEAEKIVENLFGCTSPTNRNADEGKTETLSWHHRSAHEISEESWSLNIHQFMVDEALEKYLVSSWLWCDELDWMFLQMMFYGQYLETYKGIDVNVNGLVGSSIRMLNPSRPKKVMFWLLSAFWKLTKWAIWLVIMVLLNNIHGGLAIGWLGLTGFTFWRKFKLRKKAGEILQSALQLYSSVNVSVLSWKNVERLLSYTQTKYSIAFDSRLMRLVEIRVAS